MNAALAALAAVLPAWDEADPATTGRQAAQATQALWPTLAPSAVAALLGAEVRRLDRDSVVCGRRVWAEYDAGTRVITVFDCAEAELPGHVAHELFHHLEATVLGRARSREGSERAAAAFARCWEETSDDGRTEVADCER